MPYNLRPHDPNRSMQHTHDTHAHTPPRMSKRTLAHAKAQRNEGLLATAHRRSNWHYATGGAAGTPNCGGPKWTPGTQSSTRPRYHNAEGPTLHRCSRPITRGTMLDTATKTCPQRRRNSRERGKVPARPLPPHTCHPTGNRGLWSPRAIGLGVRHTTHIRSPRTRPNVRPHDIPNSTWQSNCSERALRTY